MKIIKSLVIPITLLLAAFSVQAKIAKEVCIENISQILDHLPQDPNTIVAFDWDKTISSAEGNEDVRETDAAKGTIALINELHKRGIKTLIVSARFNGKGLKGGSGLSPAQFKEVFEDIFGAMKETLEPTKWAENGALKENALTEMDLKPVKMLTVDSFVFAGGGLFKGAALKYLIDNNKLKFAPNHILFIDNADFNLHDMKTIFADRPENVYLFHYPQPTGDAGRDLNTGDTACPKENAPAQR